MAARDDDPASPDAVRIDDVLGNRVRYVFPRRAGGTGRGPGLFLLLFGAFFGGMPLTVVLGLWAAGEPDAWIATLLCLPFVGIGGGLFVGGLWSRLGHAEVILGDGELVTSEALGPIGLRRRFPFESLVDLTLRPSGPRGGGRAELVVRAAGREVRTTRNYPSGMLRPVVEEVARRVSVPLRDRTRSIDPAAAAGSGTSRTRPERARDVPLAASGLGGALSVVGGLLFLVVWNTISWGLLLTFWFAAESACAALFALVFVVVGLAITVGWIMRRMAAAVVDTPRVVAAFAPLRLGERVTFEFQQRLKSQASVPRIDLVLRCRESATYRRGTDTTTVHHDVWRAEESFTFADGVRTGLEIRRTVTFTLPEDAMHTWTSASRNRVRWLLDVHTHVDRWPDRKDTFEVEVAPVLAGDPDEEDGR